MARDVFPNGEVLSLTETVGALETGGREEHWGEAVRLVGEGRARVWRLYMVAAGRAFELGRQGVNQVLAQRPGGHLPPLRRSAWL